MRDNQGSHDTESASGDSDVQEGNSMAGKEDRKNLKPVAGSLLYLVICVVFITVFWSKLRADEASLIETLSNIAILVGGPAALIIAVWRSSSARDQAAAANAQGVAADKQAKAASAEIDLIKEQQNTIERQLKIDENRVQLIDEQMKLSERIAKSQITSSEELASKQRELDEAQLKLNETLSNSQLSVARKQLSAVEQLNKAYTKQQNAADAQLEAAKLSRLDTILHRNSEALGHSEMTIRVGAIHALSELIAEDEGKYGSQIVKLLSAFVREPPRLGVEVDRSASELREDVQAAIDVICPKIGPEGGSVSEGGESLVPIDLHGAKLQKAVLQQVSLVDANLKGVDLSEAVLSDSVLKGANLSAAILVETNFDGAILNDVDFSRAKLLGARMVDADRENAKFDDATYQDCVYGLNGFTAPEGE